ncbi:hypothetical protein ACGFIY_21665 [Micromonospora chersina]|uniref:hypothetical protein n=1 Tax=Micromonospora chersina TaxID=47854 RepID=UPI003710887F
MSDGQPAWTLHDFEMHLDVWIQSEEPSQDLVCVVAAWMVGRVDDPYQGVQRENSMPNLWFGPIPGTDQFETVVTCSYFIEESTRSVKCVAVATLNRPV